MRISASFSKAIAIEEFRKSLNSMKQALKDKVRKQPKETKRDLAKDTDCETIQNKK